MSECTTIKEYEEKYQRHAVITGRGASTRLHIPCPFCAEPEFLVYPIIGTRAAMEAGAVCAHCGRGCRAVFTDDAAGGISFELFQTVGSDPPSFIPRMQRATS
jgi:hypothetical protein